MLRGEEYAVISKFSKIRKSLRFDDVDESNQCPMYQPCTGLIIYIKQIPWYNISVNLRELMYLGVHLWLYSQDSSEEEPDYH